MSEKNSKQSGFTILEILVATLFIGILLSGGIYFVDVSGKREVLESSSLKLNLIRNFPAAIMQVYQGRLDLSGTTASNLTATKEVFSNKPVAWSIATGANAPNKNRLALIFTLKSAVQAEQLKDFLVAGKDSSLVSDASQDSSNMKKLIVTYTL